MDSHCELDLVALLTILTTAENPFAFGKLLTEHCTLALGHPKNAGRLL